MLSRQETGFMALVDLRFIELSVLATDFQPAAVTKEIKELRYQYKLP